MEAQHKKKNNHGLGPIFHHHMGMGQNLAPLVNIKIAGKWMFIPLKMVFIGIDPYPYDEIIPSIQS
jgi:hypothetical protein